MQITEVDVDKLIPYVNNPRNNDEAVQYVAASIKEFGFKVPVIIDKDNVIVTGHTRLRAAKKLGLKKVPCILADDLTEQQIKAFRLADNKVSELAEWDIDKLNIELEGISDLEMIDFGFDEIDPDADDTGDKLPEEDSEFDDIEKLERFYGVPYQGNKSRIADIIISILPKAARLVDLFGGGGAITHCAMLSGKWERFLYNDLNEMITGLFMDAVNGKYHNERRVITREDFENLKDTDAYVKYIWSFGNNGQAYLWGKDIEGIKCTACHALMDADLHDRRLAFVHFLQELKETKDPTPNRLQVLERLEALERLQALEALERLQVSNIDYRKYEYQEGDVVYCDVPYEKLDTNKCEDYGMSFNSLEFYEWVKSKPYQIYFSSYEISDDTFYKKKIKSVMSLMGSNTNGQFVNEYLYSNMPIE